MLSMQANRCPFARDKLHFGNYVLTIIHTYSSKKTTYQSPGRYDPAFE